MFPAAALVLLLSGLILPPIVASAAEPELPRVYIDTTYVSPTGRTIAVAAGGNFQAALNSAQPGDMIVLQAGAVFRGPFTLPNKPGAGWVTVRTSAPDSSLPPPGTRVTSAQAPLMPRLVAPSGSVITTAPGAHHYRFIGLEISPAPGTYLYNLVLLESPDGSSAGLPHDITFDRSYLHGDPMKGTRRGIALNSGATAVIDSYLSDFKEVGADSQAITGWNGPGPFKIVNNYLEAAGENLLFGGADPSIRDLVPADIEIRRNHLAKPLTWKIGHPQYASTPWAVKNLLELKNARRVLIEGNLFEKCWPAAQAGFAILFTVRNQYGTAPWSTIEDVTFRNNIIRHSFAGVSILGRDDTYTSQQVKRVAIINNLFADIASAAYGGTDGKLFQVGNGMDSLTIEHNTAVQPANILSAYAIPNTNFVFRYNVMQHTGNGVVGDVGVGTPVLATYFPGYVFQGNIVNPSVWNSPYPPGNYFITGIAGIGFVDAAGGDYRLGPSSPFRGRAPDGSDLGANLNAIKRAMGGLPAPRSAPAAER